jgi:hypothetical protein
MCILRGNIKKNLGQVQDTRHWHHKWNIEIYNLHKNVNIVDEFEDQDGRLYFKNGRLKDPPPKKFLIGNFILQDHWENQEQDGRTSSGGIHHRY